MYIGRVASCRVVIFIEFMIKTLNQTKSKYKGDDSQQVFAFAYTVLFMGGASVGYPKSSPVPTRKCRFPFSMK